MESANSHVLKRDILRVKNRPPLYVACLILLSVTLSLLLLRYLTDAQDALAVKALLGVSVAFSVSSALVTIINSALRKIFPPRFLPAIDLSGGIGVELTTLVVIPDLLMSKGKIDDLVANLHNHLISSDDPNIYFGLLTDWMDSSVEHGDGDDEILSYVLAKIQDLNQKHASDNRIPFFLLHRKRLWVENDKLWMGYERKRGKLEQLNELIVHGDSSPFILIEGDLAAILRAKFVITLDNDTRLPEGAARKLISIMAHPSNTPQFDESGAIISGHAILQPKMLSVLGENPSWLERFRKRENEYDPQKPQFNIYHEVFELGCFTGVGIYTVKAFERALRGKIPDNLLLSHDIVEGNYARSGRARDVMLFETVPPTYRAESQRRHRWTRGDWQNAAWLFSMAPTANGSQKNPFDLLSRWKIFEPIRAALFPAMMMWTIFLCAVTNSLFGAALVAIGAVTAPIFFNIALMALSGEKVRFSKVIFRLVAAGMILTFMAFEAWITMDAAVRSVYRMTVSKKRLLQWVPSSVFDNDNMGLGGYLRYMWISPAIALALSLWAWRWSAHCGPLIVIFMVIWAFAPVFAWYISRRPNELLEAGDEASNAP